MKVVITGGGTGGHLFPGLAIADELRRRDPGTQICFIGTNRGLEARLVPQRHYRLETVPARGITRRLSVSLIRDGWCFFQGMRQSSKIMKKFGPDIAVGTGGYVSAPVMWAAHRRNIPCLLQEQNSYPGLTTRWLAGAADRIHLNFKEAARYLKAKPERIRYTGNPVTVRTDETRDRAQLAAGFGLVPEKPVLLVVGGSQGARSINRAVGQALPQLAPGLQVLWQCGRNDFNQIQETIRPGVTKVAVREFIDDMAAAYSLAALAVCRAGAMTLTELALFGVPAILVPLPIATGDHQRRNAEAIEAQGAARMILDRELDGARLAETVNQLMADTDILQKMSAASRSLARPRAAEEIVDSIYELVNAKRN